MTINSDYIHHIAQLARLSVAENTDSLAADLSRIIDLVDQLSQVNTDGVEPLFNSHDAHQILRSDIVEMDDRRTVIAELAPEFEENLFLVPKVIE